MAVYGYARVSTSKQDIQNQELEIHRKVQSLKSTLHSLETETISSRNKERKIFNLVERLEKDDVLIVSELSRLGRSMIEINQLTSEILNRKAKLIICKNDMVIEDNIQSHTLVFALGISAQVERDLISQRTKTALAVSKRHSEVQN